MKELNNKRFINCLMMTISILIPNLSIADKNIPTPYECHSEHIGNSLDPGCVYDACVNCWVSGYFYNCSGGSSGEEGYTTDCECSLDRPTPSPFNFPKFLLENIEHVCKTWAFYEDSKNASDVK